MFVLMPTSRKRCRMPLRQVSTQSRPNRFIPLPPLRRIRRLKETVPLLSSSKAQSLSVSTRSPVKPIPSDRKDLAHHAKSNHYTPSEGIHLNVFAWAAHGSAALTLRLTSPESVQPCHRKPAVVPTSTPRRTTPGRQWSLTTSTKKSRFTWSKMWRCSVTWPCII